MSKSKGRVTQGELNRVIKAAKAADALPVVIHYPNGVTVTIGGNAACRAIAANDNGGNSSDPNPWDTVLNDDEAQPKRPS